MFLEKLRKKWNDRKIFFLKPKRSDSLICVSKKEIGNKSGILIGLNYPNSFYSLNGCVNDVKNGDSYLKTHGYDSKFLDDSGVTNSYNVLEALEELGSNDSKYVFFHYSGHGTQQVDKDGDEVDGMDEVVYSIGGKLITDDEINKTLSSFPEDKIVFLIFDCCHSGTIADLPYISSPYGYSLEKVPKFIKAKMDQIIEQRINNGKNKTSDIPRNLNYPRILLAAMRDDVTVKRLIDADFIKEFEK